MLVNVPSGCSRCSGCSNSMHSHSKPLTSACIILLTSSTNHHELQIEIIDIFRKARDFWIPPHTLKVVKEEAMKQ